MKVILQNVTITAIGFLIGSAVNMGLIMISGQIIPPPEGADVTTMEGLKESIHLFQPKHFLFPFLAHSLGTFFGAFFYCKICKVTPSNSCILDQHHFLEWWDCKYYYVTWPALVHGRRFTLCLHTYGFYCHPAWEVKFGADTYRMTNAILCDFFSATGFQNFEPFCS